MQYPKPGRSLSWLCLLALVPQLTRETCQAGRQQRHTIDMIRALGTHLLKVFLVLNLDLEIPVVRLEFFCQKDGMRVIPARVCMVCVKFNGARRMGARLLLQPSNSRHRQLQLHWDIITSGACTFTQDRRM